MTDQHTGAARLTEAEFRALYDRLRAMPDWGPHDRRGALNYLTPDLVAAACRDVRLGRSVSMAAELADVAAPDNPEPVTHELGTAGPEAADPSAMTPAGRRRRVRQPPRDAARTAGLTFAIDRFAMNVHGDVDSHLDALCHVIYDGHLYNGVPAGSVTADGATALVRGGRPRRDRQAAECCWTFRGCAACPGSSRVIM